MTWVFDRVILCFSRAPRGCPLAREGFPTDAGLSDSFDGPTHHSITDLAILRSLPNMTVVVPADPLAVARLLPQVAAWDGPVYFRLCRNEVPQIFGDDYRPEIGQAITLIPGTDVTVICCGVLVSSAIEAARVLAAEGLSVRGVEMHTVKPLDIAMVERCASETGAIVTAEEHSVIGGLGGAVAGALVQTLPVPLERVGLADTFAESGPYLDLLNKCGLSVAGVVGAVRRVLERRAALVCQTPSNSWRGTA